MDKVEQAKKRMLEAQELYHKFIDDNSELEESSEPSTFGEKTTVKNLSLTKENMAEYTALQKNLREKQMAFVGACKETLDAMQAAAKEEKKDVLKVKDWVKKNEVKIKCPFCKTINCYTKDVWAAISDEGENTNWDCKECDYPMVINNKTLKVEPYKEDKNYELPNDSY